MTAAADVDEHLAPQASRWNYQRDFDGMTRADLAFALQVATTPAEVDQAAHLCLVLFDVAGTMRPFTEQDREWPSLHTLTFLARRRVDGFAPQFYAQAERLNDAIEEALRRRKRQHFDDRKNRDAQIERIGFINATSTSEPRRTR